MGAVSRVVFVHGLESGPFGKKTQQMRKAGFDVRATQMPCGLPELSLRVLGLDPLLTSSLLFFGVAVVFAFGWVGFAAVLVAVLLAWSIRPRWLVQLLVQRMLNRCVEVQERFLALLDDCEGTTVYVGSSFGGAVLFELMRHGKINGPSLFLAPAVHLVAKMCGRAVERSVAATKSLICHGGEDNVVPLEDSKLLSVVLGARLIVAEGEGHQMHKATRKHLKEWIESLG